MNVLATSLKYSIIYYSIDSDIGVPFCSYFIILCYLLFPCIVILVMVLQIYRTAVIRCWIIPGFLLTWSDSTMGNYPLMGVMFLPRVGFPYSLKIAQKRSLSSAAAAGVRSVFSRHIRTYWPMCLTCHCFLCHHYVPSLISGESPRGEGRMAIHTKNFRWRMSAEGFRQWKWTLNSRSARLSSYTTVIHRIIVW